MSSRVYFDSVSDRWDAMRQSFFSEQVRERAMAVANPSPSRLAADIGAGTGFMTEGLLLRGLRVIAVDQSKEMLRVLTAKFQTAKRLDCRLGQYDNLPVEDSAVEYVFANMYLHHTEDPATAVREMARILSPGGMLVVTDLDSHDYTFLRKEHCDRWLGFERTDVVKWFEEAGLINVQCGCLGLDCCADSCDGTDSADISIFLASGTKSQE